MWDRPGPRCGGDGRAMEEGVCPSQTGRGWGPRGGGSGAGVPPPAPTHAFRWHRDWMQMSRRRRSRGRGGPRLGCSASAAGQGGAVTGGRGPRALGRTPPAPGLTRVQRGGERVETGDGRRVLAAGQVQAGAAAEGALGVGLRGARRSVGARPPPAPPARRPGLTR